MLATLKPQRVTMTSSGTALTLTAGTEAAWSVLVI